MTRFTHIFIAAGLLTLLLAGCASAAAPAAATLPSAVVTAPAREVTIAAGVETPASSPTLASSPTAGITPTVAAQTGLKPGRWEGSKPNVTFDVLADGRIANLSLMLSVGNPGSACLITMRRWDPQPDATFSASLIATTEDMSDTLRRLLGSAGRLIETADGTMALQQSLNAKVISPTQIEGTFDVPYCNSSYYFSLTDGAWAAEWKNP